MIALVGRAPERTKVSNEAPDYSALKRVCRPIGVPSRGPARKPRLGGLLEVAYLPNSEREARLKIAGSFGSLALPAFVVPRATPRKSPITSHASQPGREIISFDVHNLDQIVERIPSKKPGTKW